MGLNSNLSYGERSGDTYTVRMYLLTFFQCPGNSFRIKFKFLAECAWGQIFTRYKGLDFGNATRGEDTEAFEFGLK